MRMNDKPRKQEPKGTSYQVKKNQTIEDFLSHIMQGKSRTSIKQLLQNGAISVNNKIIKRLDELLEAGQTVFIGKKPEPKFPMPKGLRIIWEDKWLIVVKKESGLLTVGNEEERKYTAQAYLNAYMQFKGEGECIFIVHRIDRDTSGILIFAKSEEVQFRLRTTWNESVRSRSYIAIVEGHLDNQEGTIDTWIDENKYTMVMHVCPEGKGKRAITHYKVLKTIENYSMLALELETGRKNQIRIHMSHIGHPVAGDGKYGAQTSPCGRLCLHAQQIEFVHPMTREVMEFTSEIPQEFVRLFKKQG